METTYDGIVLWYNDKIGYGLINGADGETYFILFLLLWMKEDTEITY